MRNLKIGLLPVVLLGLASCIDAAPRNTAPKIPWSQEVTNAWVGRPVTRLLSSPNWGAPTKTYTISGREYVVYVREGTVVSRGSQYSGGYAYNYVGCTWTWEIKNGIIVSGNGVGEDCDG